MKKSYKIGSVFDIIREIYKDFIAEEIGELANTWPIVVGCNIDQYQFNEYNILVIQKNIPHRFTTGGGKLTENEVGFKNINKENFEKVRKNLSLYFSNDKYTYIMIIKQDWSNLQDEMEKMFMQEKIDKNMFPMKIFLCHKGENKELIRDIDDTLKLLGFDTWLDENAMNAGADLNRSILEGIQKESCAIVFFITEDFEDKNWIRNEVNYAIQRKTIDENFAIITIVFSGEENVPELLKTYVYKTVTSRLEGLREILKGLPIKVGYIQIK